MRVGADLVGGIDPSRSTATPRASSTASSRSPSARRRHRHPPARARRDGAVQRAGVLRAHARAGMQGKVTISHGFCLGGITESKQQAAAEMMAQAGVALATHGAGGAPLPPLRCCAMPASPSSAATTTCATPGAPTATPTCWSALRIIGWRADLRHDPRCTRSSISAPRPRRALGREGTASPWAAPPISSPSRRAACPRRSACTRHGAWSSMAAGWSRATANTADRDRIRRGAAALAVAHRARHRRDLAQAPRARVYLNIAEWGPGMFACLAGVSWFRCPCSIEEGSLSLATSAAPHPPAGSGR